MTLVYTIVDSTNNVITSFANPQPIPVAGYTVMSDTDPRWATWLMKQTSSVDNSVAILNPSAYADTKRKEMQKQFNTVSAAGITVNDIPSVDSSIFIETDKDSVTYIISAYIAATNNIVLNFQWETSTGFISLTPAQVIIIGNAVFSYTQKCFNNYQLVLQNITNC